MSLLRRIEKGSGGEGGGPQGQGGAGNESESSKLQEIRSQRKAIPGSPGAGRGGNNYMDLKSRVQTKLLSELDSTSLDIRQKNGNSSR
jgi:hypothetical protein